MAGMTSQGGMRPLAPTFAAFYMLAHIGAFAACLPLLTMLVPLKASDISPDGKTALLSWTVLVGAAVASIFNIAGGASWVSFHHGGGVGIGYSLHAGQVVVADGTPEAALALERVLTNDPGTGVMRHAEAGYDEALRCADERGLDLPFVDRSMSR